MTGHEPGVNVLDEIVAHKRREVAERETRVTLAQLKERLPRAPAARRFEPNGIALIAEVKRRSPSRGELATDVDPVARAIAYSQGGAAAISVLTDERYFGGSFADLAAVREAVTIPVLCKDFILTPYQVCEARVHGADLLLLIVSALGDRDLRSLYALAVDIGLTPLVEVHDQHDLARAMAMNAGVIGINNRDLTDFSIDLLTTEYLAPLVPDDVIVVSESGILTPEDVRRAVAAGARAVLVGEVLMRSPDPANTLRELLG